ncbi:disrupted in schizophrenia 1 protein isoform X2 [Paramormyrops kingsleyae]|uniref:disrupted in schizophrenia 1 protein isoform X2 n=1 Tax=Paramormyrops kingsleyae TaxID=1676925 RepID=UPI003B96DDA7
MFAGMVRLGTWPPNASGADSAALPPHPEMRRAGGRVTVPAGRGSRKRLPRRPGYMRPDLHRHSWSAIEGEGQSLSLTNGEACRAVNDSHRTAVQSGPLKLTHPPSSEVFKPSLCLNSGISLSTVPQEACRPTPREAPNRGYHLGPHSPKPVKDIQSSPHREQFNSSFSFIRLSLSGSQGMDACPGSPARSEPISVPPAQSAPVCVSLGQSGPVTDVSGCSFRLSGSQPAASEAGGTPRRSFSRDLWGGAVVLPCSGPGCLAGAASSSAHSRDCLPDSDAGSVDAEAASSLSADSSSDSTSGSSVTSGYESAVPCGDRGWEALAKKYEGVLQKCLQGNQTSAKIESLMMKLQGLQQKAVLEDDYDTAERFGRKLDELRQERSTLVLGLPSKHPSVSRLLERLLVAVRSAQQRAAVGSREGAGSHEGQKGALSSGQEGAQCPLLWRDHLLKEKRLVEEEMQELQRRLASLRQRSTQLERELLQEERLLGGEEDEGPALWHCSPAQLHELGRALEDTVTSEHRAQLCTLRPLAVLRLQEREQALNTSIREATAKVVMSQKLGSSLRRKVSESETQLLALHEAKMAAISGGDFSSAKEVKVEMKCLYGERDHLEALAKRLRALSARSSQELARMKEEHGLLKGELQEREARFEEALRSDAVKYVELLEDRLHSCGNAVVERIWEADLEACHVLLRSLQLRATGTCGPDVEEESPEPVPRPEVPAHDRYEPDCAMLTALGGRWCPDANLQHSEFAKKLEDFLFCMEESPPEDVCSDATDIMEQCESIGLRLQALEELLGTALLSQDQPLAQSLQGEVQEVKSMLQAMLEQLRMEEDEDDEKGGETNEVKHGEEDEDPYFSDSWEI